MSYIPYLARHVRASLAREVRIALAPWTGSTPPVALSKGALKVEEKSPGRDDLKPASANTAWISFGSEPDTQNIQLGSGVLRTEAVLFVDIFAENPTVALMMASDVTDRLRGLAPGSCRHIAIRFGGDGTLLAVGAELDDVWREEPDPGLNAWQSVKATCYLLLSGEDS